MRYPASLLDDIRARLPLSTVVGRRVQWDRRKTQAAKGDFWACCPFHNEKSPSFHADDRRGRYHCFGCGKDGDAFTFLTDIEGITFPEAVERLAAEAGVPLPAPDREADARDKRQAGLVEVMEMAAAFFEAELAGKGGAIGRAYLEKRKITASTQRAFRLGYAGSSRSALKQHLGGKGVSNDLMVEAGLLITGDDIPVPFDRFRDRVMFPITDLRGRVVAFGGRALSPDAQAKYLNSPETPLFTKGSLVYHGREAREAARGAGTVIAVEGYVDVIAMAQAGFVHTVAPLGTALTERQLHLMWRMAPEPILCFDGDPAGYRAALRAIDLALPHLKPGLSLRFAMLPEGRDPDDLINTAGADAMREVLEAALPLVQMLWDREIDAAPHDTPERRAGLEQRIGAITATISDPSIRKHYEQDLRGRLAGLFTPPAAPSSGAPSSAPAERRPFPRRGQNDTWRGAINRGPTAPRYRPAETLATSGNLRRTMRTGASAGTGLSEATLVLSVIHHPALLTRHFDDFAHLEFHSRELDSLRRVILELAADSPVHAEGLAPALNARGFGPLLMRIERSVAGSGAWQVAPEAPDEDAEQAWLQAVTLHRRARALHKELKDAEAELARDGTAESLTRLIEIQNQLSAAENIEAQIDGFGRSSGRQAREL
ncbi:MAG: DNA primase [Bauldia sp.]|nr:DNA primase [Bauldia sp.]